MAVGVGVAGSGADSGERGVGCGGVGEGKGESNGSVSPWRINESGPGVGLAVDRVTTRVAVWLGMDVLCGATSGVKAVVTVPAGAVGVTGTPVTTTAVGVGVASMIVQPAKKPAARARAGQILLANCQQVLFSIVASAWIGK